MSKYYKTKYSTTNNSTDAYNMGWDIEKYRDIHECDEHWQLRKAFMEKWKNYFPEDRLVCLARVYTNIEIMGCRYPAPVMQQIAELSFEVGQKYKDKKKTKLQRTFVSASTAAEDRARGIKRVGGVIVTDDKPKTSRIAFVAQGEIPAPVEIDSDDEGGVVLNRTASSIFLAPGPQAKLLAVPGQTGVGNVTQDVSDITWQVTAHKRPCKRSPRGEQEITTGQKGLSECGHPNRRARREALKLQSLPHPKPTPPVMATAAAETQREPTQSNPREPATAPKGMESQNPPPPIQEIKKRKPRGRRGRRLAAAAPTAPETELSGDGGSLDGRASSKCPRLDETQTPRGDAKRAETGAKPKRTVSNADATQLHLMVAVITVPPRDLSTNQAEQLREAIEDSILQAVLSPQSPSMSAPSFRGRPFLMGGVLAMWCEDANALSWLERTVKTIPSPIPNTSLAVIKQSEMKKKLKAGLLIHTRITEAATLYKVLCAQNPWYKVDSWQLYDMTLDDKLQEPGSKEKVVHLILGIPENQKQVILDRDRRVAHMTGCGYIRFFTSDEATKAEANPAATNGVTASTPSTSAPC